MLWWKRNKTTSLQNRFIARVIFPPFLVLLILSIVGFWQYSEIVESRALDDLSRASEATSLRLEREIAIRKTVLETTGEELFDIKSEYASKRNNLDEQRDSCRTHLKRSSQFLDAPNNSCDPFLPEFARLGFSHDYLGAVEDGYIKLGNNLNAEEQEDIAERLNAFSAFFPETSAIVVLDSSGNNVSFAITEKFPNDLNSFEEEASVALKAPVVGKVLDSEKARFTLFGYKTKSGAVMAAFDLDHPEFIRPVWENTPVISGQEIVAILSRDNIVYPVMDNSRQLVEQADTFRKGRADFKIAETQYVGVARNIEGSEWLVSASSPEVLVFSAVRDAQVLAMIILGVLLVSFIWVGTFFVRRLTKSVLRLVGGSLLFASGKLDYTIELDKGDAEFVQLADTMNSMAHRIAEAEKQLDEKNKEFISIATHELKAPMTLIIGNLSMVFEQSGIKLDEKTRSLLDQAYSGTIRLRNLVTDLLDVARIEGGRAEFKIESFSVTDVIQESMSTMSAAARDANITLRYTSNQSLPLVKADKSKLAIIVTNLISNAIKYNKKGGAVTVANAIRDNMLLTSVSDNGLGIPENQKSKIFEKFFRVDHSDRKSVSGTGLGMYITKRFVEHMGGKIWFESSHGKGTTFYFTLPIYK